MIDHETIGAPPYRYCDRTKKVWGQNAKIGGETVICDMRGWGYLTGHGHGALAMSDEDAWKAQDEMGSRIARLLNEAAQET